MLLLSFLRYLSIIFVDLFGPFFLCKSLITFHSLLGIMWLSCWAWNRLRNSIDSVTVMFVISVPGWVDNWILNYIAKSTLVSPLYISTSLPCSGWLVCLLSTIYYICIAPTICELITDHTWYDLTCKFVIIISYYHIFFFFFIKIRILKVYLSFIKCIYFFFFCLFQVSYCCYQYKVY